MLVLERTYPILGEPARARALPRDTITFCMIMRECVAEGGETAKFAAVHLELCKECRDWARDRGYRSP